MNEDKEISWGKKMIKISVNFWTNDLPKDTDEKTAWGSGAIHLIANKKRGLKHSVAFFKNVDEFFPKLEELLKKNGVKLIEPPKTYREVDLGRLSKK